MYFLIDYENVNYAGLDPSRLEETMALLTDVFLEPPVSSNS